MKWLILVCAQLFVQLLPISVWYHTGRLLQSNFRNPMKMPFGVISIHFEIDFLKIRNGFVPNSSVYAKKSLYGFLITKKPTSAPVSGRRNSFQNSSGMGSYVSRNLLLSRFQINIFKCIY